jgi:NADH:ubiquinone oxidoreductase subunit C
MTREEITAFVASRVSDMKPGVNKQFPEVIVAVSQIHELAKTLKSHPDTKFDYLFNETAADRKDGFHMIYHITSSVFGHSIMVKVILPDKVNPIIPTVSDVWKAAEFYEREIFDLFGIKFENHPNLKRIFLEDDWIGYPLRKDYKDSFTIER